MFIGWGKATPEGVKRATLKDTEKTALGKEEPQVNTQTITTAGCRDAEFPRWEFLVPQNQCNAPDGILLRAKLRRQRPQLRGSRLMMRCHP